MIEMTIRLADDEWRAVADLADAQGISVEDLAQDALLRQVTHEQTLARHHAERLAARHANLLRRLGE
ncbi:CopG family transcriptional regulator [Streptomyces sp. NPDC049597]|uniref:CopG family transcriptional regulator n=1 Tax=Streptomyces sp. NPDC049597 TaxID=3155276 RepID=UPI00344000F7